MHSIIAFGNPLLDLIVKIKNDVLLYKYKLDEDSQIEVDSTVMKLLLQDLNYYEKIQSPGGSAQNTLRTIQWLLGKENRAVMVGSVGKDENGQKLKQLLEKDGVIPRYIEMYGYPTGTTVSLTKGSKRSLIAHLGAAEIMNYKHITRDIIKYVEESEIIYMEGFFLTKRDEIAKLILNHTIGKGKTFVFNLSAEYLCKKEPQNMIHFVENCNILFGNQREFQALADLQKTDYDKFARYISLKGKIVVVTNGAQSIKLFLNDVRTEINAPIIEPNLIIDTTGAGDAFVAGFLAGIFRGETPHNCCRLGCYAAKEIIKNYGCVMPEFLPDFSQLFNE